MLVWVTNSLRESPRDRGVADGRKCRRCRHVEPMFAIVLQKLAGPVFRKPPCFHYVLRQNAI